MRRDYFTLTVEGLEGDGVERPVVTIGYEGPTEQLESRLTKGSSLLEETEVDVAYRLQDDLEERDPQGVVALADRVTGEYIFELNAAAEDVFEFIDAAREFGENSDAGSHYRILIETDDGHLSTYDKSTLLVFDSEGELLRSESLIPGGVEL